MEEKFVPQINPNVLKEHLKCDALDAWIEENFQPNSPVTDNEYSMIFIGDMQKVTYGDWIYGTKNIENMFAWIADNAKKKNAVQVIVLGDITEASRCGDPNLACSGFRPYDTGMEEWDIVKSAIDRLKGKVPYTVLRGNHDGYQIDEVFGTDPDYTSEFGGFFRDDTSIYYTDEKHSITNSWKTFEAGGNDYLLVTIDYNTNLKVIDWARGIIEAHPNHKVIISTHAYMYHWEGHGAGLLNHSIEHDEYKKFNGVNGEVIWNELASKYENVVMVVGGHVAQSKIFHSFAEGDHGNRVLQLIIDPSTMDLSTAFTGLVAIANFSEGGKKIEFEYYSTVFNKYKKDCFDVIKL